MRAVDSDASDDVFLTLNTYLEPSTLTLADARRGAAMVGDAAHLRALPAQWDASACEAYQREATSADGTSVPYFVVAPKGARRGSAPTLLYGYGGFEISMTPGYLGALGAALPERGYAYAVANIRGGGEFGPSWHQAALREKRQAAYDDFAAVAEDLIGSGLTSAPRLAIRGGSNGGLLVGNLLVRGPSSSARSCARCRCST